ncbi:sodium:proton antiporter [Bacillaceae bacterium SIJ1]|uniref:cation:proton antiporter n=1 Tax=Litoribacterium kuwaitense TaxID=1398745 RepID=UPI0013EB42AC|nr:sodium:proton antiporter [Litoribacterium kuwaitense]NGP45064.1 sodium:proton antiporter [Litoribacterium kuwaitense]
MLSFLTVITIVIVLGIVSQWLAWRFRLPAIVVMAVAGLLIGPAFGLINPEQHLGDLFNPIISLAVAVILFEGSLQLDFREIKGLRLHIYRIVTLGGLLAWIFGSLAAHYVAGLSWALSFVIGALFIVTGPTVIIPLLRQAKLKPRPASVLKWEGIIVDPLGAILAVFAYELVPLFFPMNGNEASADVLTFFLGLVFSVTAGYLSGRALTWLFTHAKIPEFLKSPVVLSFVLAVFALSDEIMHEMGLLAVTAMGLTLANQHKASVKDIQHFKENISILLTSTIFILLTASLNREVLNAILQWPIVLFVILMLFVVRPLSIWISTIGTKLTAKEKILIGWIAPRGIVALTVAGYFAESFAKDGYPDAELLIPLTFALSFATVCAHGFSIQWLARKLQLANEEGTGVLFVGSNTFTIKFAEALSTHKVNVLITDTSWERLSSARRHELSIHQGEVLSDHYDFTLDVTPYDIVISATEIDSYNALVSRSFVHEFGSNHLYQTSLYPREPFAHEEMPSSVLGQQLFQETLHLRKLIYLLEHENYSIQTIHLTEDTPLKPYTEDIDERTIQLAVLKPNDQLYFFTNDKQPHIAQEDVLFMLAPSAESKD